MRHLILNFLEAVLFILSVLADRIVQRDMNISDVPERFVDMWKQLTLKVESKKATTSVGKFIPCSIKKRMQKFDEGRTNYTSVYSALGCFN